MLWTKESSRSTYYNAKHQRSMALNMFRNGMDTVDIAEQMRITESQAVDLLDAARAGQPRALAAERMGRAV